MLDPTEYLQGRVSNTLMNIPDSYKGKVVYLSAPLTGESQKTNLLSWASTEIMTLQPSVTLIIGGDSEKNQNLLEQADAYVVIIYDDQMHYSKRVLDEISVVRSQRKPFATIDRASQEFTELRGFEKQKNHLSFRRGRKVTLNG